MQHVPPGWGAAHDRWLAQSAYDQGWFTSMQKKRAYKIMEVRWGGGGTGWGCGVWGGGGTNSSSQSCCARYRVVPLVGFGLALV